MKQEWLDKAYLEFAENGPQNISINKIAKEMGASRSSFYHHFSELDILIEELLSMHYKISQEFIRQGKERCNRLIPDLYSLLAEYPIPLKFSRQLFHHKHIPNCNFLFIKTYEESANGFILDLFAEHMNLNPGNKKVLNLYQTLGESWYSRLDPDDLSAESMQKHAEDIMKDLSVFITSDLYSALG